MKYQIIKLKVKCKVLFFLIFFMSVCLSLSACTIQDHKIIIPAKEQKITIEHFLGTADDSLSSQQKGLKKGSPVAPKKEKVIESWEGFNAANLPVIAAIPDKNIYLYGIKPSGVILYVDGNGHYFDWHYNTTRFVLPKMDLGDFDQDGEQELSVIFQIDSGTGFAQEELHIIELVQDNCYQAADYLAQLKEQVKFKTYTQEGVLMAEIKLDKEIYLVNLQQLQALDSGIIIDNVVNLGNIVHFKTLNNKITAQFSVGLSSESYPTPLFIGDLYMDIQYDGTNFTFNNMKFEAKRGLRTDKVYQTELSEFSEDKK